MIAGERACWRETDEVTDRREPKAIVIADWSLQQLKSRKRCDFIDLIKQIHSEGCDDIYISQNDKLVKCEPSQLYDVLHKITPKPLSNITREMAAKGISADHCAMLDYFNIRRLFLEMDKNNIFPNTVINNLDIADIKNSNFSLKDILEVLHDIHPTSISTSSLKTKDKELLNNLLDHFPEASIRLILGDSSFIERDILEIASKVTELDLNYSTITGATLAKLLQHTPKLQQLKLMRCKHIHEVFSDPNVLTSLQHLTELDLSSSTITGTTLAKLLQHTPKLQKLNLINCEHINKDFPDTGFLTSLQHLTELDLGSSTITGATLAKLLQHTPKLQKLKLSCCGHINEDFPDTGFLTSLQHLTELDLSSSTITGATLAKLLQHTPKLQKLNLRGCKHIHEVFSDPSVLTSLQHLTELDLSSSTITGETLAKLLQHTPKLQKLKLRSCKHIHEDFPDTGFLTSLQHLTKLDLGFSTITGATLAKLLQHTPKLQRLNLSYCEHINENFPDTGVLTSLQHLTELDLSSSNITGATLAKLLKQMPNLNKLHLNTSEYSGPFLNENGELSERLSQTLQDTQPQTIKKQVDARHISPSSPHTLDDNTNNKEKEDFKVKRFFFDISGKAAPAPNDYRCNVYSVVNASETTPAITHEPGELDLVDTDILNIQAADIPENLESIKEYSTYLGQVKQEFPAGEWMPLPSLKPQETMQWVCIESPDDPDIKVEIKYSRNHNLYYLKAPKTAKLNLRYLLAVPDQLPQIDSDKSAKLSSLIQYFRSLLPQIDSDESAKLSSLIQYFRSFQKADLNITKNASGKEILKQTVNQKVGSCLQRSAAFIDYINDRKKQYNIKDMRLVTNGCHAFVEIQLKNDEWFTACLGGYPSKLDIEEPDDLSKSIQPPEKDEVVKLDIEDPNDLSESIQPPEKDEVAEEKPPIPQDYFVTWAADKTDINIKQFTLQLIRTQTKNCLLEFSSEEDIENYMLFLQEKATGVKRPVYVIHSPEELRCLSAALYLNADNSGEIRQAPAGPLHDFLTKKHQAAPIIIVNWANFETDDLVRHNTLIDDEPRADGTPIPEGMLVVGLYHKHPDAYRGEDFMGRHDHIKDLTDRSAEISELTKPFKQEISMRDASDDAVVINLFHSTNWKSLLLGRWQLEGQDLTYLPEPFINAIQAMKDKQTNIHIKNGPWELPEFRQFWNDIKRDSGFKFYGQWLNVLENLDVTRSEGYDWANLTCFESFSIPDTANRHLLNPSTLSHCFGEYDLKEGQLYAHEGWLEKAKNSPLFFYVTRNLSLDQWAQLLTEAKKYQITIRLQCAPNITLPDEVKVLEEKEACSDDPMISNSLQALNITKGNSQVIISDDANYTAARLTQYHPSCKIVTISENESSDLFYKIDSKMDGTHFQFSEQVGAVWQALQAGETVILKGKISPAMADQLASLCENPGYIWHDEQKMTFSGQLIIVSEQTEILQSSTHRIQKSVSFEDKLQLLRAYYGEDQVSALTKRDSTLKDKSYAKLDASLRAGRTTEKPMVSRPLKQKRAAPDLISQETHDFEMGRKQTILNTLECSPSLIITGNTGVGKSTFMQQLSNESDVMVLMGEAEIENWAEAMDSGQPIILFIDEANLKQTDWSIFEDLFNQTPSIYYKGKYHPLSENHKVIFARNPKSYGGERTVPAFFTQHPISIEFERLPAHCLVDRIINPILNCMKISDQNRSDVSQCLLDVYQKIESLISDRTLITARELQMMAMVFLTHAPKATKTSYQALAHYCAASIAEGILDVSQKVEFNRWFEEQFKITPTELLANPIITYSYKMTNDFLLTQSHKRPYHLLMDSLAVREHKQNAKELHLQSGGLNLLILEGMPGIGKSHFIKSVLVEHGFSECKQRHNAMDISEENQGKKFYHLPVSASFSIKERILLKAFHEGAIVIIDEINSSVMMERLLNTLLMGTDPEGNPAKNPGFMIIGTQNPIHMAGRLIASQALQRRGIHCDFPEYTQDEMIKILMHKGVGEKLARNLVGEYLYAQEYAKKYHHSPAPTFRDLLRAAKQLKLDEVKHHKDATQATFPTSSTFPCGFFSNKKPVIPSLASSTCITSSPRM